MTKGSGMIHPQMATTLGFVMTDANIPVPALARDAEAVRGAQLQSAVRRWRHVDQRHPAPARQRRFRCAAGPQGIPGVSKKPSRR